MAVNFAQTTVSNPNGVQGVYPLIQTLGAEGAIADMQAYVTRSYRNQTGGVIPFGVLVATDNTPTSNDTFAADYATGPAGILGLATEVKHFEVGGTYATGAVTADSRIGYPNGQTLSVLSKGVAWVFAYEAVALGDAVRFLKVANTGSNADALLGRFGKTSVANKTVAITTGARWLSETTGAGLALLELDIPAAAFTADTI